jgi:hypothetical protein
MNKKILGNKEIDNDEFRIIKVTEDEHVVEKNSRLLNTF